MKKIFTVFIFFVFVSKFLSQNKTLGLYLNKDFKITKVMDSVFYIKESKQINDSLWEHGIFNLSNRLHSVYKSKDSLGLQKHGKYVKYNLLDSISEITNYANGLMNGLSITWFENGEKNHQGYYKKGYKEGLWKYYYFEGNLAAKVYYKKDSISRAFYYNEFGEEEDYISNFSNKCNCEKIELKTVGKLFQKIMRENLSALFNYTPKGRVFFEFYIDTKGEIKNLSVFSKGSKEFGQQIEKIYKDVAPLEPAIHLNRKITQSFYFPITFFRR